MSYLRSHSPSAVELGLEPRVSHYRTLEFGSLTALTDSPAATGLVPSVTCPFLTGCLNEDEDTRGDVLARLRLEVGDTLLWLCAAAAQPHAVMRERARERAGARAGVVGEGFIGLPYHIAAPISHLLFKVPGPPSLTLSRADLPGLHYSPSTPTPTGYLVPIFSHAEAQFTPGWAGPAPGF